MMGPLDGIEVVELSGIGPISYVGMMLADLGAVVTRVDRPGATTRDWGASTVLDRGRRSLPVDLKDPAGLERVLGLAATADALIEGFRPGVTERIGIGPEACMDGNPALVYGRMTGWGQAGPLARTAGHDINYLAISGALHMIGEEGRKPVAPVNLLGDFGAGATFLAFGVVCALLHARATGEGQVVDAAIVDGAASVTGLLQGYLSAGAWRDQRGVNLLDGGAPFYDTYRCADDRWVAVGALEPRFFRAMLDKLDLSEDPAVAGDHLDPANWRPIRNRLTAKFAEMPRDSWAELFAGSDCCITPVLSMYEAREHPWNAAREVFVDVDGELQPAPAPRFSATPARRPDPAPDPSAR
jgi:alpha-methylacyl-CoA racemase